MGSARLYSAASVNDRISLSYQHFRPIKICNAGRLYNTRDIYRIHERCINFRSYIL